MSEHSATLRLVGDGPDRRVVAEQADDVIWISPELIDMARDPNRERHAGDLEIDGDLISFGTPGEGLGRLTYRAGRRHRDIFGAEFTVAVREVE